MAKAREVEGLDCRGRVLEGVRRVLATRFEEMCDYRDAALDFSDIEGVHSMRVASRRLRSAMRDFEPYLNERPARRRVKRVADALGAVRDEDVAIVALSDLAEQSRGTAGEETAQGIRALIAERERRRDEARTALAREISDAALAELRERFLARLEAATRDTSPPPADLSDALALPASVPAVVVVDPAGLPARLNFVRAGREIVQARAAELRQLSASLYRPFDI
ncbi:MAG TPA: CHAD domain-containing protein, partial [Pyrinomonadaceae bacterium]|nr:CHAD domain-containing protein [Pyrinomonadaceae bacterium]